MLILLPLLFFVIYAVTLLPGVGWGDVAKYQVGALTLDWPAEAGQHGLYSILCAAWARVCPWGTLALKANLFSAITASAALGAFMDVCQRWGVTRRSTILATFALGLSHTFWTMATWAESYPLFACLWILAVGRGLLYLKDRKPADLAWTLGLFGLVTWVNLMSTQALAAFVFSCFVLVPECRRPSTWVRPLLAFLVGLSPWLGRLLWAFAVGGASGEQVLTWALDLNFSQHLWIFHPPSEWIGGAKLHPLFFLYQFGLMAVFFLRIRRLPAAVWLFPVLLSVLLMLFCSTYLPQRAVWVLMAAWLPLFLLLAQCLDASVPARWPLFFLPLTTVGLYALAPWIMSLAEGDMVKVEKVGERDPGRVFLQPWKHDERSAGDFIAEVEASLKSGDLIVCDFTPGIVINYAREVEGRLRDIHVVPLADDINVRLSSAPAGTGLWLGRDSPEFHKRLDGARWRTARVGSLLKVERIP